jgi:16S rRNA (guanine1516-N2)-methyltransferase
MPPFNPALALLADPRCPNEQARHLAIALGIPLVNEPCGRLLLRLTLERLELCKPGDPELPGCLWVDFEGPAARLRLRHPGRELVVRATKVRHTVRPLIIDATAGLGRDGFLLAAAGCRVRMFERNPVVAALLLDGLQRAGHSPAIAAITERIQLIAGNVLDYLAFLDEHPDVIYLDPMFPQRSKSAKVKQDLRLLQLLDDKSEEPEQLLQAALAVRPKKVVVKRPLKGPLLPGPHPSYMLKGKAVRFDVYVGGIKEQTAD